MTTLSATPAPAAAPQAPAAVPLLFADSPGLTRDEDHVYRYQGRTVPGITRLMEPIHSYDGVPEWILERKAELGSMVHYATELYDRNDLDESQLHESLVPYLEAWKRFRREHGGPIHAIEPMLYHPAMGYAGQPDRMMSVDTEHDVLEIKTTSRLFNAVGVQLAAQERVIQAAYPRKKPGKRFAIQLKADGRYQLREYKEARDWPTFLSLLTVHNWNATYYGK